MSIIIENEYEGEINIPYEKIAHEVIEAAIDYVDCPLFMPKHLAG